MIIMFPKPMFFVHHVPSQGNMMNQTKRRLHDLKNLKKTRLFRRVQSLVFLAIRRDVGRVRLREIGFMRLHNLSQHEPNVPKTHRLRVPPEGRRKSYKQTGAAAGRSRDMKPPGLGAGGGAAVEGGWA